MAWSVLGKEVWDVVKLFLRGNRGDFFDHFLGRICGFVLFTKLFLFFFLFFRDFFLSFFVRIVWFGQDPLLYVGSCSA